MSDKDWNQVLNNLYSQNQYGNLFETDNYMCRELLYPDFKISLKYHPDLKKSLLYDISNSIAKDCYFCKRLNTLGSNRIQLEDNYFVELNPYSVFFKHYYIYDYNHHRKSKVGRVFDILFFADRFREYIVISDGLEIPMKKDHHFFMQLINQKSLPIEDDCKNEALLFNLHNGDDGYVGIMKNYARGAIVITSKNKQWIGKVYFEIEKILGRSYAFGKFPYLNILCWYRNNQWDLIIIPRVVQRPTQYYDLGKNKIKISLGAIDMGGVFFVALAKDFDNLTTEIISNIYSQVSFGFNHLKEIITPLKQIIKHV